MTAIPAKYAHKYHDETNRGINQTSPHFLYHNPTMTTNYAPKGTPAPYDELRSLYLGIADYRNNVKARAQYAQAPHIPIKNKSLTTR